MFFFLLSNIRSNKMSNYIRIVSGILLHNTVSYYIISKFTLSDYRDVTKIRRQVKVTNPIVSYTKITLTTSPSHHLSLPCPQPITILHPLASAAHLNIGSPSHLIISPSPHLTSPHLTSPERPLTPSSRNQ